jgi:RNA polymerase sigma-70 factor (ECF subfamily)
LQHGTEPDPPSVTDSTSVRLLARARGGDHRAVELLFGRLLPYIRRWAHGRLPQWARKGLDTADIVQDVLVRAFSRLDGFEPRQRQALRAYLRQAVRNRILDELRHHQRTGLVVDVDQDTLPSDASPHADFLSNERWEQYRGGLNRLSESDREAVVARLELGYSYEQIALMTGRRSADAARMAVKRAVLQLARHLHAG